MFLTKVETRVLLHDSNLEKKNIEIKFARRLADKMEHDMTLINQETPDKTRRDGK